MGIVVPDDDMAYIRVGPDTKRWTKGGCLSTIRPTNMKPGMTIRARERVVLHVDFFNTLAMTPIEIEVMPIHLQPTRRIYEGRGCCQSRGTNSVKHTTLRAQRHYAQVNLCSD
jgi:hypothetical protein